MKRVLLGIGGFVLALLAMLVLPVLSAGHQETTPASEIKSVTGFQCKDEPQCEVDIWKYNWKHHREEDFYYLGIYTLTEQDAARFESWAQEKGWSEMPLSEEAMNSGLLDEETCPEAAEIKQVTQGFWKGFYGVTLYVFDSQTATLYIRKMPR